MKLKTLLVILISLAVVAVLAFFLRELVTTILIVPMARFFWLVGGYYHAAPQSFYWAAALVVAGFLVVIGFRLPEWERQRKSVDKNTSPGPVQELSFWIQRSKKGLYPRWHIARLLAEMTLDMLDQRGRRQKHILQDESPDRVASEPVKKYLEAALNTNFTDYPKPKRFSRLPATPFDGDIEPIIIYLESLVEKEHESES